MNRVENAKFLFTTHGRTGTPEHGVWKAMIRRCYNQNAEDYRLYGARGIRVCGRWRRSFAAFLQDMRERPSGQHSLERIDCNGPYSPKNCKWATSKEQANNRRGNRWFTIGEDTTTLAQWCDLYRISYTMVFKRLRRGWPIVDALSKPPRVVRVKTKP